MTDELKTPSFIDRLKTSTPTMVGVEAYNVIKELLNPQPTAFNWVIISSDMFGMETAELSAQTFIDLHAAVVIKDEKIYTPHPLHILHCTSYDAPEGTEVKANIESTALLYSNGAVAYFHDLDTLLDDLLVIWIDKSEANKAGVKYTDPFKPTLNSLNLRIDKTPEDQ